MKHRPFAQVDVFTAMPYLGFAVGPFGHFAPRLVQQRHDGRPRDGQLERLHGTVADGGGLGAQQLCR